MEIKKKRLVIYVVAAFLAGAAVIGLAAALAHHNRNHDDRDERHDDDYSRGYQDALYGATYDRNDSEAYHDGYLAGESERSNRRASNTDHVRRAPWAAQQACSARADDFQNRPRGSGRHDRFEEQLQVANVCTEVVDMAGIVLGEGAVAQALAAPVQRSYRKATLQQFARHLRGILLDELAATGQHHHRAARRFGGIPESIAQQGTAA